MIPDRLIDLSIACHVEVAVGHQFCRLRRSEGSYLAQRQGCLLLAC